MEFQVNTYTTGYQRAAGVDLGADGSFVVVWTSDGSFGTDQDFESIQARRFAADGTPLDPAEFQVNVYTTAEQWESDVEILADGSFVVAWTSYGSFGSDDWYESVQARRFAADGTPLDAVEFQVNGFTPLDQYAPRIDSDPVGNFVVTWTSRVTSGDDTQIGIQGRRFAADGTPLDPVEFQVNTYTPSGQLNPDVAVNAEGDFVVTFETSASAGADQDGSVQARRYRADGTPVDATEFQVNAYTTSDQGFAKVDSIPEGDFVAVWTSRGSFGNDQSYGSIQARRFGRPTIPVTSLSGGTGGPGCKLRDAVAAATSDSVVGGCPAGNGGGVVELPPGSVVALTEPDNGTNGLPLITRPVTIRGRGARIERDPGLACPLGPELRLAEVAAGGVLALEEVAVSNGCLDTEAGAGVLVGGGTLVLRSAAVEGNETGGDGGGVAVESGALFALDSTLRGNLAAGSGGGLALLGAPDRVWVSGSTLSENVADTGGGLAHEAVAEVVLRNSTVSGNLAWTSGGGVALDAPGAELLVEFATLTGNAAPDGAGARVETGLLSLHGSLLGENQAGTDCAAGAGTVDATGLSLDTDGSCATLAGGGVATVASLGLGPLADNGGASRSHLPLASSPALDAAPECATRAGAAITRDQRGYPRPTDDDGDLDPECELGAVERGPLFLDGFESGSTVRWSAALS